MKNLKYRGRIITFSVVFVINFLYILHYYLKDGYISWIEIIGLPIMLVLAWWFGKQYDNANFYKRELENKEQKLTGNYQKLEEIFNSADVMLWSNDLINNRAEVSKGIEDLFGYKAVDFHKNNTLWLDCAHPDDKEKVERFYNNLLTGKSSIHEWRSIRSDGQVKWIQSRGKPIFDKTGKVIKLIGVLYDISKLKEVEKAIRIDKEKYKHLMDFFPEPIIIHREGKVVYVNEKGAAFLNANNKREILGKMILDFVHPDDHELVLNAIYSAMQSPFIHQDVPSTTSLNSQYIEQRLIRLDGEIVTVEATGIAILYEGKGAILTIGKDITKRKEAEELLNQKVKELDESERKYRTLFENANDIVALFKISKSGVPSNFINVNNMACQKLGYNFNEFSTMTPIDITPPESKNNIYEAMQLLFENGHITF